MKRTDITNIFPDATEDQVKLLMDLNGADVNSAKAGMDALRAQLAKAPDASALQQAQDRAAQLEQELNTLKAGNQLRDMREKVAKEKNVPASLLTGDTEDACTQQADALLTWRGTVAPTPNYSVDGMLGVKSTGAGSQDAALAQLASDLFPE